jgi:hypothetical protein
VPTLDVSDIPMSEEFADSFTVLRRPESVNDFGESVVADTTPDAASGTVTWASPTDRQRLDDQDRGQAVISIVTTYRLRGPSKVGAQQYKPDIVLWAGNHYEVLDLQPYTRFGAGFVQALAGSIESIEEAMT